MASASVEYLYHKYPIGFSLRTLYFCVPTAPFKNVYPIVGSATTPYNRH